MSKPTIITQNNNNSESKEKRQIRQKNELSELHKKYKTMNSENLHNHFINNKKDWEDYHKISEANEESFPTEEIPRNRIIEYLENLQGNKCKDIVDLGCGFAEINEHFVNNRRFNFTNFDHVSAKENIISKDIMNTGLEDYSQNICIMSLAMWGSNCKDYISECYRILDIGGTLLIIEPYKRWYNEELSENKLEKLLIENGFTIIKKEEKKFVFIEARK